MSQSLFHRLGLSSSCIVFITCLEGKGLPTHVMGEPAHVGEDELTMEIVERLNPGDGKVALLLDILNVKTQIMLDASIPIGAAPKLLEPEAVRQRALFFVDAASVGSMVTERLRGLSGDPTMTSPLTKDGVMATRLLPGRRICVIRIAREVFRTGSR